MKDIDTIISEICFENGFINDYFFIENIGTNAVTKEDVRTMIGAVARRYSKEAEKYYRENSSNRIYCPICGNESIINKNLEGYEQEVNKVRGRFKY